MTLSAIAESFVDPQTLESLLTYGGPERRGTANAGLMRLLACVLDEVDYGLVLISADGHVIHANHGARSELSSSQMGLQIRSKRLTCHQPSDQLKLNEALKDAQKKGKRCMLRLGIEGQSALSIVPLPVALTRYSDGHAVLVTLQRHRIVETLSISAYARAHGLSVREEQVLACLCDGLRGADIATQLKISQATVRSHVHNLKAKTGCSSMLELVKQVAVLPPMVEALNRSRADTPS